MSKILKASVVLSTLVLFLTTGLEVSAHNSTIESMYNALHGTACSGYSDWGRTNSLYQADGLKNTAPSSNTFVCSLNRTNADDHIIDLVEIDVYDPSLSDKVECTVAAYDDDGDLVDSYTTDNGGNPVSGDAQIFIGAANLPADSSYGGFYVLWCSFPPNGILYGVSYYEDEEQNP